MDGEAKGVLTIGSASARRHVGAVARQRAESSDAQQP